MSANRAIDWLRQAENDFLWARDTLNAGRYAQACFIAQHIGEKSLKALAYKRGFDLIKSHSVLEISRALELPEDIKNLGKLLDLYYIPTRYPDAFPSGAPFEYFTHEQASNAIDSAEHILIHVREALNE
jgi:HEPN domain-containing protein